jgi:hypothetical protein
MIETIKVPVNIIGREPMEIVLNKGDTVSKLIEHLEEKYDMTEMDVRVNSCNVLPERVLTATDIVTIAGHQSGAQTEVMILVLGQETKDTDKVVVEPNTTIETAIRIAGRDPTNKDVRFDGANAPMTQIIPHDGRSHNIIMSEQQKGADA